MKYYVNSFYDFNNIYLKDALLKLTAKWPNMQIGLFKDRVFECRGNFCGWHWYGAEYYLNTKLLAYYEAEGSTYNPKARIGEVHTCHVDIPEIPIGSCMWEYVIEADTDEEAIEKFIAMDFAKEK